MQIFKRRFFVLQPATYLYYFVSADDTTPRGCWNVEDCVVRNNIGSRNSGGRSSSGNHDDDDDDDDRTLLLQWKTTAAAGGAADASSVQQQHQQHREIILQARTAEQAAEWKRAIQQETYTHLKQQTRQQARQISAYQSRVAELEASLEEYRLVEQELQGAVQDAVQWKEQFLELDESLRLLTRELRRTLQEEDDDNKNNDSDGNGNGNDDNERVGGDSTAEVAIKIAEKNEDDDGEHCKSVAQPNEEDGSGIQDEKKEECPNTVTPETTCVKDDAQEDDTALASNNEGKSATMNADIDEDKNNNKSENKESFESPISRETSLLDEAVGKEEKYQEKVLDAMTVPGSFFNSLYNVCEQLKENHRLASKEAATAVEDLTAANERVIAVEARMAKAEKHLCKLWEENCTIRKALKQKKREKRVLVREVKALLESVAQKNNNSKDKNKADELPQTTGALQDESSNMGSDEEKLLNELEEHVLSSIRLHEEFLGTGSPRFKKLQPPPALNVSMETEVGVSENPHPAPLVNTPSIHRHRPPIQVLPDSSEQRIDRSHRRLLSLFDESSDEEEDEEDSAVKEEEDHQPSSGVSSVVAEASDSEPREAFIDHGIAIENIPSPERSPDISPDRPNPIEQLDTEEEDEPQLCPTSSNSESSKSVITLNGHATSKLSCPLTDVIDPRYGQRDPKTSGNNELQVYHLTFYSRKIGLQFQKIPPPPAKPKGLLTEAMTADLVGVAEGGGKTAAELRRIAAFSSRAKSNDSKNQDMYCNIVTPVDAVIVCGFHGFDDSGSNVRPKLGARLVAFDGVSVELGKWTFDSIRKAIQARARPLTLSFRNDFLTTEQRKILTRAAREVNEALPPTQPIIDYQPPLRTPSPSVHSAQSGETPNHYNNAVTNVAVPLTPYAADDEYSQSATGSDYRQTIMPQSFSATRSVSSSGNGNAYSFSDTGSSSSVLSAVAPLVTNLLRSRKEPFTPDYLRREPESVENTPQHQDFKSELL